MENERKLVSPERAARFARILKVPESALIRIALQDMQGAAHLNYQVQLRCAWYYTPVGLKSNAYIYFR